MTTYLIVFLQVKKYHTLYNLNASKWYQNSFFEMLVFENLIDFISFKETFIKFVSTKMKT